MAISRWHRASSRTSRTRSDGYGRAGRRERAAHSKAGTESSESVRQSAQVVWLASWYAVDVTCRSQRAVRSGSESTDQDVLDAVPVEDGANRARVEWAVSHGGLRPHDVR